MRKILLTLPSWYYIVIVIVIVLFVMELSVYTLYIPYFGYLPSYFTILF